MQQMSKEAEAILQELKKQLPQFCYHMENKLNGATVVLDVGRVRDRINRFFQCKQRPNNQQKTRLNILLRHMFRQYLEGTSGKKFIKAISTSTDSLKFNSAVSDFWDNYQRFTFALQLISDKGEIFFKTFTLGDQYRNLTEGQLNEVAPISVIAVNEMLRFVDDAKIIKRFSHNFCENLAEQRKQKQINIGLLKSSIEFFESCYFDFDAICKLEGSRPVIRRAFNSQNNAMHKHSTADKFFDTHIIQDVIDNCEQFYKMFVKYQAKLTSASEEIEQMIEFLRLEKERGCEYFHHEKNFDQYIDCVYQNLICFQIGPRINKEGGFRNFLVRYDPIKGTCEEELQKFWAVYECVKKESLPYIKQIFEEFLRSEGATLIELLAQPGKNQEFISAAIFLCKKSEGIVKILGDSFELNSIRGSLIEATLAVELLPGNKSFGKFQPVAKCIMGALNNRIKTRYQRSQSVGEEQMDILNLVKHFKYKTYACQEYWRLLCTRLLEELDMDQDAKFVNAITMEQKLSDEMKKITSESDVKNIQKCILQIKESEDLTNSMKHKVKGNYPIFNQAVIKSSVLWAETTYFDIEPPLEIHKCSLLISQELKRNIKFEYFSGVSSLMCKIGKNQYKFQIRNIYIIILLLLDEKPNKKMFFSEIIQRIRPSGRVTQKAYLELSRNLIELLNFGILSSNKDISQAHPGLETCQGSDYFQINQNFSPAKKMPVYKTASLLPMPDHIKKAFAEAARKYDDEERLYQKDRKIYVESHAVKKLKHAHHKGNPNVSIEELLNYFKEGRQRELNVDISYLKGVIEVLISKELCERVDGKFNSLRYIA